MAGEYLPPVEARLTMDIGDLAAKIAQAKAMMNGLKGSFDIKTDGLDAAAAKVAALKTALSGLNATVKVNTDGIAGVGAKSAAAAAATTAATGVMINGWRLTGTMIHWVIAGGAELLAVTLPALVALGAGLAVMAQGAVNVQAHMNAVYTATEATANMFHTTAGQVVGMGNALQKAQDAANPSVYGILGSAIITVNEHFGNLAQTGLQVTQMFQTFAAKVAVDFGPNGGLGNTVTNLLARMVPDLQQLGQVFGNTGHALLNFASAMPGLAEVLLSALSGVTGLISHLSGLAPVLITVGMGFEEFQRWGGLAVTALNKIGLASIQASGKWYTLEHLGGIFKGMASVLPVIISQFGRLVGVFSAVKGTQVAGFAASLEKVIGDIPAWQAAVGGAAVVALGFLIYKLVTAKTAAQQFSDSLQAAVMKTTNMNAFNTILNNIADLNTKLATAPKALNGTAQEMMRFGNAAQTTNPDIAGFNAGIQQQKQDLANVSQGAAYLAQTYHTNLVGALALADAANVKLAAGILGTSQNAEIARMQIASLVQGYTAMGAPASAVGADLTAIAIQAGLQNSKVNQLNQAWDQYMQLLTGGTSNLAGFVTSISNIGNVVANFKDNLGKALSIKDNVSQFATALKSFGTQGAAAWQNFDQVVGGTAPQLIDWLRTAGAAGALSGPQFTNAVLGMASSLMPLAADSKTAQAEVLGLVHQVLPSITTWGQLTSAVKTSGASMKDTTSAVETATGKLGDMAKVAQNLGTVMQSALITALSSAKIAASGAGGAMQTYEQDIMNAGTSAAKTAGDRAALIADLEKLGYNAKQAAALIDMVTQKMNAVQSKTVTLTVIEQTISTGSAIPAGVKAPGFAKGTSGAPPGWAWVGEAGPELVKFNGGEKVIPSHVATGFAGGTGMGGDTHVHVYLDGKQIYSGVAKEAVQAQRRTGHNGLTRRSR